jgi:hypothetical protein
LLDEELELLEEECPDDELPDDEELELLELLEPDLNALPALVVVLKTIVINK